MLAQIVNFYIGMGQDSTPLTAQGIIVKVIDVPTMTVNIMGHSEDFSIAMCFTIESVPYNATPTVGCWNYPS